MIDDTAQDDGLPSGAFIGRDTFREHLRVALSVAANRGWSELLLCDADFHDWPLGERAVVESLHAWARRGQRLVMLAKTYDDVPRQHARFVEWRRLWSHKIECRQCREADVSQLPSALWSPHWALQRLDRVHGNGLCGTDAGRRKTLREDLDEWLARSSSGFPAYTLGL
ncbi:hypothetical protein [Ottowia testudinis]|uniref:Uncharacterized protein n=1 Tax=Ottowia testudinis TaxID=2816950 RepID=A0A975H4N6_9BURK|nr:hypothetical protein [Ottowia testudinis]QTD47073.1 hypothetical protein J1M35_09515 [Ottowia testudinis]